MAEKSVTIPFQTREEAYESETGESVAGFNSRGEPLRARLEIDTEKTAGSEPYSMVYTLRTGEWHGQDVFLKYFSNSGEPIVAKTTNGEVVITAENIVSEKRTETLVFTTESSQSLSGIPTNGAVSTRWVGNVLSSGESGGSGSAEAAALCAGEKTGSEPNVTWDGESVKTAEDVTGVLEVTYTETYAEIKSNAAEAGTVVVAVCQGLLAEAEQYEIGYPTISTTNPDEECCKDDGQPSLSIPDSFSGDPGWGTPVYISGGCPPFSWAIEGVGFSIVHETTEVARHNTVELSDDACGDGILIVTDVCGASVESVVETDVGCCEDQGGEPFAWADGNDESVCMMAGVTYHNTFAVTGGVAPYKWAVTSGSDVAAWGLDTTTAQTNTLRTWADDVTTIRVRVQDACGEVIHRTIYLGMEWDPDNPETIGQDDEVAVSVIGGIPPFHWAVSGSGYSLGASTTEDRVNLLISDESACGSAEITVTDDCGQEVTGSIRGTEGEWINTGEKICPWSAIKAATEMYHPPSIYEFTGVHGKWKVVHKGSHISGSDYESVCVNLLSEEYCNDSNKWQCLDLSGYGETPNNGDVLDSFCHCLNGTSPLYWFLRLLNIQVFEWSCPVE